VGKNDIARQILGYVTRHPDAQDTLEGILKWWLMEQQIIYHKNVVQSAVDQLVQDGLLIEVQIDNQPSSRYHVNWNRLNEIKNAMEK
jgi:hypothetical protein